MKRPRQTEDVGGSAIWIWILWPDLLYTFMLRGAEQVTYSSVEGKR